LCSSTGDSLRLDEDIADLEARALSFLAEDVPDNSDSREDIPEPKSVTYLDYEDPFALVDSFSGAPHISRLSANAWVGCGNDIHILECLGKGYIRIEPVPEDGGEHSS
jgi:ATP-dependent helicase IRC3